MITLQSINKKNIWRIIELKVHKQQEMFVATNTESILEAYVTKESHRVALPFGLYDHETLVGFTMIGYGRVDEDDPLIADENFCIWRFMIDQQHQRKGYGKQALQAILNYMKEQSDYEAKYCWLSYEPENIVARDLYATFGFIENGEICDDEIVACLKL